MLQFFKKRKKQINLFDYKKNLPLLISSQLQRSGGSLISQLFDNHPEILAHPWEIMIYKEGTDKIRDKIFKTEKELNRLMRDGYRKGKFAKKKHRFHFLTAEFSEALLSEKFDKNFFNYYFDNFFKYWTNFKNDDVKKKLITGFSPFFCKGNLVKQLNFHKRLNIIHIYRDPYSWWHSAKNFKDIYKDINAIKNYWMKSQTEALEAKSEFKDRVFIIKFNDLIYNRSKLMRYLCKKFFINYDPKLMFPTFNGQIIENDSSFKKQKVDKYGIVTATTNRYKKSLLKDDFLKIKNETFKICEKLNKKSIKL